MPIALFLQQQFGRLAGTAAPLDRWREVLAIEALVIDRARGAFLSTWFGTRLPRAGDQLLVGIVNLDALAAQYRHARAPLVAGATGPNLVEPLAGLAGMALGLLLSPSGIVLALFGLLSTATGALPRILFHILFDTSFFGRTIAFGVGGAVAGVGLGAAAVLLPIGVLAAIVYVAVTAGTPNAAQLAIEALGALARFFVALPRLVSVLLGPRSGVGNPLIASLLGLVDRMAALFAQGIGAIGLIVTRIGPLILPWTREFLAIRALAEASIVLVKTMVNDARAQLEWLWSDAAGALPDLLAGLFQGVMAGVDRMIALVTDALLNLAVAFIVGAFIADVEARNGLDETIDAARRILMRIPLIATFRALGRVATVVRTIIPPSPAPAPSPSGGSILPAGAPHWPGLPDADLLEGMIGPRPPMPTIENAEALLDPQSQLGSAARFTIGALPADTMAPFGLTAETQAMIARLTRAPASIVADQLAATAAEAAAAPSPVIGLDRARELMPLLMGIVPAEMVEQGRAALEDRRVQVQAMIAKSLMPLVRARLPALRPMLAAIDAVVTAQAATLADRHPVRVPDNGRLRPIIGRLTVVLPDGDAATARNFANDLTGLLRAQPYLAAA
ncbi:hypothetical protein [Sphingomonas faeni]|uniref:hypothetical protein n=1 Tax=Sphingomonas faeni TaxID=185950 RepID=UPI003346C1EC